MLSRFIIIEIPPYTYEQFEGAAVRIVKKLYPNVAIQIASSMWKSGSRGIREVMQSS